MARKELAGLLAFIVIIGPLTYLVMREELRQSRRLSRVHMYNKIEDAVDLGPAISYGGKVADDKQFVQTKREADQTTTVTQEQNKELYKRLLRSRHRANQLQIKINELNEEMKKCTEDELAKSNGKGPNPDKQTSEKVPTVFIITPTYKRFVQKAELTRVSQAFKGIPNLHWILVEDSLRKTKLVEEFLKNSGLKYTHLNIRTPDILRKQKGEFRRFKPRGVFQRNAGIQWLRNHVDPEDRPGVVYFADDDNTYDSRIFEKIRWIKGVGVWPVAFTGAARWAGPICRGGKVIRFHTNWGKFRPFPIDMAGFAINIDKLIIEYPHAKFKAMKRPGMLESSLLKQITTKEELEPVAECQTVYVWHTRTQQPRDSIIGEKQLIREGIPSNPNIQT